LRPDRLYADFIGATFCLIFQLISHIKKIILLFAQNHTSDLNNLYICRMKRFLPILYLFLFSFTAFAQTDSVKASHPIAKDSSHKTISTLFGDVGKPGWWIGPEVAWTKIEHKDAFMVGLSGGVILKHCFSIGLAGYGIVNSHYLRFNDKNDTASVYLYGGYGGLRLEYRIMPFNMVNVSFPLLIGGGGVTYSTWDPYYYSNHPNYPDDNHTYYVWDSYFVIEPGICVGLNILKFMRLDAGISYRYTSSVYLPRTDEDLMSNMNMMMSLKFGKF
jgi:hypothetical protein